MEVQADETSSFVDGSQCSVGKFRNDVTVRRVVVLTTEATSDVGTVNGHRLTGSRGTGGRLTSACKHRPATARRTGRRGTAVLWHVLTTLRKTGRRLTAMFGHVLTTSRRFWRQLTVMFFQSNWSTMVVWASSRTTRSC
ncbi:hypothetical protein V3C99_016741 [Haemonchus contortus]